MSLSVSEAVRSYVARLTDRSFAARERAFEWEARADEAFSAPPELRRPLIARARANARRNWRRYFALLASSARLAR